MKRPLALGAITLALASSAHAQTAKGKPAPAATRPAPPPPAPRASAIVYIATAIAEAIGKAPSGTLVVVSPLTTDIAAPKGDELALRVAAQVAGKLGARVYAQPATLAVARGVAGHAGSLVYVQLELAKGELRATADLYPVVSNSWDRLRQPAPGPQAHAFAGAPIDAEIRTFFPPILLEQAKVRKATHDETDVLAVACGDVDADGGNEIVIATRSRVLLGRLHKDKLVVARATPWAQLASRAAVPMREPLASVAIDEQRSEVLVGTTDRGGIAVDPSLITRRHLTGLPIPGTNPDVCALPSPELSAFEGSGVTCQPPRSGDPAVVLPLPTTPFDAASQLDLVAKDGSLSQVVAAREPNGKLRLRRTSADGKLVEAPIEGAGAQIAVADLDLDGTPEIAFSSDTLEGDVLSVMSWQDGGLIQRLRLPTSEGIRAIAVCPPEEKGVPGLVAVVGSEVWLVR